MARGSRQIQLDRRTSRYGCFSRRRKCGAGRAIPTFNRPCDIVAAQDLARAAIQIVEDRLDGLDWLVGDGATIADIVVYTYVGLIWEGQVELTSYPNVIACMRRIEALPNYVGMDGLAH